MDSHKFLKKAFILLRKEFNFGVVLRPPHTSFNINGKSHILFFIIFLGSGQNPPYFIQHKRKSHILPMLVLVPPKSTLCSYGLAYLAAYERWMLVRAAAGGGTTLFSSWGNLRVLIKRQGQMVPMYPLYTMRTCANAKFAPTVTIIFQFQWISQSP